jgi:hypothetical protein
MSYDLYLFRRPGADRLGKKGFADFFKDLEHFRIDKDEAHYHNEATGVYFHFAYSAGKKGKKGEPATESLYFNLNFFRSHIFGLEAADTLENVVEELDLTVSDPQLEGMGDGEFTRDGFLRGWNAGNRFAHSAILSMKDEQRVTQPYTLPAAQNEAYWRWTYERQVLVDLLAEDGIDVFVPRIMFLGGAGGVRSMCIWPNLVPTAVPEVDEVLVARDQLPEKFAEGVEAGYALVPWKAFRKASAGFRTVAAGADTPLSYALLDYGTQEDAPPKLADYVRQLPGTTEKLALIEPDQILDEELVREYAPRPEE